MQTQPDEEFQFITAYQDYLTKFIVLKPLKTKTAEKVAYQVADIFTLLGVHNVLKSDNRKEFANQVVVSSLKKIWFSSIAKLDIRSQGNIEQVNDDIENMLSPCMQDAR